MQLHSEKTKWASFRPIVLGVLIGLSLPLSAQEEDASIAEQQKEQIDNILIDMNNSAKEVTDTITSEPQKAIDGGCLDSINGIDLSVFTVDITNIWGAIYQAVKDEIMNVVCSAAEDWTNEQTARIDQELETPLGSVSLGQGNAIDDWQSVQSTDVELSSDELAEKVSTDTLGDIPDYGGSSPSNMTTDLPSPSINSKDLEGNMEESFNLKQLWGEGDEE